MRLDGEKTALAGTRWTVICEEEEGSYIDSSGSWGWLGRDKTALAPSSVITP